MVTENDIKKLAGLSRLELTDKEQDSFAKEIEAILGYVGNINTLTSSGEIKPNYDTQNVFREDEVIHAKAEFTQDLISNAPESENNLVKVKKILG